MPSDATATIVTSPLKMPAQAGPIGQSPGASKVDGKEPARTDAGQTNSPGEHSKQEDEKTESVRVVVFDLWDKRFNPDRDLTALFAFGPLRRDRRTGSQSCRVYFKRSMAKGKKPARVALRVTGTVIQPTPSSPRSLAGEYRPLYLRLKAHASSSDGDSRVSNRAIQERMACLERRLMEALHDHLLKEGMSEESIQERTYRGLCRYVPVRASRSALASTSTSLDGETTTGGEARRLAPILCTRYRASHLDNEAVYSTSSDKQLTSLERRSSPVLSSGTAVDVTILPTHVVITEHGITWMHRAVRILPPNPLTAMIEGTFDQGGKTSSRQVDKHTKP